MQILADPDAEVRLDGPVPSLLLGAPLGSQSPVSRRYSPAAPSLEREPALVTGQFKRGSWKGEGLLPLELLLFLSFPRLFWFPSLGLPQL